MSARPALTRVALVAAATVLLSFTAISPASAATVPVSDWTQLKAAFLGNGDTVVLGGDITSTPGENLVIAAGSSITLDLNGFVLGISKAADFLPGIEVPPTSTLTITATGRGTLTTNGGSGGAGIGGGSGTDGGTVIINAGTVNATGGYLNVIGTGAGVGGGGGISGSPYNFPAGNGGTTIINGGTVTAIGGDSSSGTGAGIGGGSSPGFSIGLGPGNGGHGGSTIINGGTVTATGRGGSAGIGGGQDGNGGTITITGGTVVASSTLYGAGIGGGRYANGASLTISGGTVTANGGAQAPGIGSGVSYNLASVEPDLGTIVLTGGTITATGGQYAPGIGVGTFATPTASVDIVGTPAIGAATDGGMGASPPYGTPTVNAAPITNSSTPAGIGYTAVTSFPDTSYGGRIAIGFTFVVSFATAGGSSIADQVVSSGGTLTEPTAPTRAGYTFAGWLSGGSPFDFSTPVTGPITLTASWTALPASGGPSGGDLAATGMDLTSGLGVGLFLLAAGLALLTARRRRLGHTD
jgi:uncharacterized repeat protein (TIGR02543 family)